MDYILADRTLIPPELSDFYSEKVRPIICSSTVNILQIRLAC